MAALKKLGEDINQTFKFIRQYKLDFEKSNMFKFVLEEDMKRNYPIKQAINDIIRVYLHSNGTVTMSYVVKDEINPTKGGMSKFMMIVSIFHRD